MATPVFRAGTAVSDITPALGGSLAGYMNDRRSKFVHDPLRVRALVLDNSQARLALAVCDLIAIRNQEVAKARHLIHEHTGIPLDHILICATHTHTGATPAPLLQSDPDQAYLDWVVVRIADTVRCAASALQPARIGWIAGQEPRLVFNRRYFMKEGTLPPNPFDEHTDRVQMNPGPLNPNIVGPAGPVDPELGLLAVADTDGAPLALIGNFALHYVGSDIGDAVSADYFAMWTEEVARLLGGPADLPQRDRRAFVPIMTNGCSGNVNNIDVTRAAPAQPYPYAQMRKVARILAAEAARCWPQVAWHDWAPLAARETTLDLRIRKPGTADIDRARRILSQSGPQLTAFPQIYARETVLMADWPDVRKTPIQAMRIGELGVVTFPGEAFVELGLEVKKRSPFAQTVCIELANDYAGYIPTAEAFEVGGYETWRARSSFLEKGAAAKMVSAGLALLGELASGRATQPAA